MDTPAVGFEQVFADELAHIQARRASIGERNVRKAERTLVGIALSGGGIRSATVGAGFLEVLRTCGILEKADYLSTVSGGGYTGGYVQSKLYRTPDITTLFSDEDQRYLQSHGDYLAPGRKLSKFMARIRLAGAFAASLVMNWVWILLVALIVVSAFGIVAGAISETALSTFLHFMMWGAAGVLGIHYFFHALRYIKAWSSDFLNRVEGVVLVLAVVAWMFRLSPSAGIWSFSTIEAFLLSVVCLGVTGFFANPNILSMHRFYRDRIAQAFLDAAGKGSDRLRLHELAAESTAGRPDHRPYPLFNTCLNMLSRDDPKFAGAKVSDYFLMSPKYMGSKTTGYSRTDGPKYRRITLSTAVAISGAALNPEMGTRTNRILTFFMSFLNLQLGYWAFNPVHMSPTRLPVTWWPYYHLLQLLCKTDSTRTMLNLSDGGHIENLAVYELLRRKCRLIVVVDAGDDLKYEFADLKNLIIRARNELGISITFRKGHRPEDRIRPSPSSGFSNAQFAIADIAELTGKRKKGEEYEGVFVYVKSSIVQPQTWKELDKKNPDYWSFTYKTMHPDFPHESTADQFFDDDQWEAYYKLGRFMAGDLLDIELRNPKEYSARASKFRKKGRDQLIGFFDGRA